MRIKKPKFNKEISRMLQRNIESSTMDKKDFDVQTKVEIIIPTLNEESSIRELLQSIRANSFPVKTSVLVIDGGSTDQTIEICKQEKTEVIKQKGKGKGTAMREAAEYSKADIIVFIDGDGTYSINDLGSLLEPLLKQEADMVVGSRLLGEREKGSITFLNNLGNRIFNKAINISLKTQVTDSLTGYRAIYRDVFRQLVLFSENFEIEVEMTVEALTKGYRVTEVPISYKNRRDSETKLDPVGDGAKIAKTLFFVIMNVKPLLFFGIISAVFFGIAVYPSSIVLYEKIVFGEIEHMPSVVFSALLIMTGVMLLALGIITELIVRSRRRIEYLLSKKNNS